APRAIASKVTMTAPAGTPADDPAPPRTHLTAESGLLADAAGLQGVNLRTSASLLKGNRFAEFIDALALEGANSPLAVDLTDLYARSAAEANVTVDNALDLQLACGMSVCALSASAPSKDVFDTWFKAFLENPTARHFGIGRHDRILEDGSV